MKLESGKNKIKELVRILGLKTIFALLAILIFGIAVAEGGWVTPPAAAPADNTAQIIHTGPAYQQKAGLPGTIRANDYWIASISKWASQLNNSQACNWSGWKCDCVREETGGPDNDGRIVLGFKCQNNSLLNFRVFDINVTTAGSGEGCLSPTAYPYCSIYTIAGQPFSPPAPYGLGGTLVVSPGTGTAQVNLSWSWSPPGDPGYIFNIERATPPTYSFGPWDTLNAGNSSNYSNSSPVPYPVITVQYFQVRTQIGGLYSAPSNVIMCLPPVYPSNTSVCT